MIGDIYVPPDKGCNIAPSCLNCPLPVCKYDLPESERQWTVRAAKKESVRLEIMSMHSQGASTQAIATAVQLTTRTVRRAIVWSEINDVL